MKKSISCIVAVLLLIVIVASGTYAFFVVSTSSKDNLKTTSNNFEIIYKNGSAITGPGNLVSNREEGMKTEISMKTTKGSINPIITVYIDVEEISSQIAVPGFVWEVVGYEEGYRVYTNRGTFDGVQSKEKVEIVKNYPLTDIEATFEIYLWLDGNLIDNEALGSKFKGYIGAKTNELTGQLK